jgi:hypothetical protein
MRIAVPLLLVFELWKMFKPRNFNFLSRSCKAADCLLLFRQVSQRKIMSLLPRATVVILAYVFLFGLEMLREHTFWQIKFNFGRLLSVKLFGGASVPYAKLLMTNQDITNLWPERELRITGKGHSRRHHPSGHRIATAGRRCARLLQ